MGFFSSSKKEEKVYDTKPRKQYNGISDADETAVQEVLKTSDAGLGSASAIDVIDAEFTETTLQKEVKVKETSTTMTANTSGTTFLAADISMSGAMNSSSDIIIEGTFEGPIHTSGNVTVRNGGKVIGDITAKELSITEAYVEGEGEAETVVINGNMKGDIIANSVTVGGNACLDGDVSTKGLVIAIGAHVHGKFDVNTAENFENLFDSSKNDKNASLI